MERSPAWTALEELALQMDAGERRGGRKTADLVADRRFRFGSREISLPAIDWSADYESPWWTYNLHYFDYAVDLARAWRASGAQRYGDRYVELWHGWLEAAERGRVRIEPYPTSVRCMNALRSVWLVGDRLPEDFVRRLLAATRAQLAWLDGHLERHLRANHLQKNLAALAWGDLAFADLPGGRRAREELWSELAEQVLADGGHFERSPMYHAGALDDFLRTFAMCRAAGAAVPGFVHARLAAMTRVLQWLSRPDGTLHLFNDAADGERPDRRDAIVLASRVLGHPFDEPAGPFALGDTGYHGFVARDGECRLVVDSGPAGPLYQPGHAHCDMLSFVLDVNGRPAVVDAGVHGYDGDPYRAYVRSTRAHNTVAIDDREQHEMWATFRVARRGAVLSAASGVEGDVFAFRGAAHPYHDRNAVHERRIELRRGQLSVIDHVAASPDRRLVGWLHFHPDFHLERSADGFVATSGAEGSRTDTRIAIEVFGADETAVIEGAGDLVQGWHCPRFGEAVPAAVIEMRIAAHDGGEFGYRLRWS